MPGPPPKSDDERLRRNAPTFQWVTLPAAGYDGPIPQLPSTRPALQAASKTMWRTWWRSPMATQWLESDVPTLLRLLRMIDSEARGTLGNSADRAEIRQLLDRFGLTPRGRQQLRWVIAGDDGVQESGPRVTESQDELAARREALRDRKRKSG